MGYILYIIAVIFIISWAVSFFAFHVTSGFIHILLVVAVIAVLVRVITGRRAV